MKGIVIYAKEYLKQIEPYLPAFFGHEDYIVCKEAGIQYDVGKWTSKDIFNICSQGEPVTILFATNNDVLSHLTNKLHTIPETVSSFYIPYYAYASITSGSELQKNVVPFDISKPRLEYLEFHAADHCNLNCKGCGHYSNLERTPKLPNIETWREDMLQLKRLFWGIEVIRIMGGEPLLNPNVSSYVQETRKFFPDADVRVVSNGLLVPKTEESLFSVMKKANCGFDITHYIPTDKMLSSITKKLDATGVDYRVTDLVTYFYKTLTLNPVNNEKKSFKKCISNFCNMISEGMIYTCPVLCRVKVINNEYGLHFPTDAGIKLTEVGDGWKLYDDLHKEIPFCRYCSPYPERFDWEQKKGDKAKLPDVVVDEKIIPSLKIKDAIYSLLHPRDIRGSVNRGLMHSMKKHKGFIPYLIYRHYHKNA